MKADLILKNIGKLVTMQGSSSFRVKEEMNKINIIENAYIAVKNDATSNCFHKYFTKHPPTKVILLL